ncbi:MAG: tRNA (adenosine(37)-N6)-threonylcarbamoyltransferase complex dimerization subunit type 1 TsaB [Candidatus Marinimicrobia bacterium]|nr:tRNA (adenosine(37)-N6)-threonylcarbamoyltransferase complex dimerization subunit type 1 TsaB [Candidatus Neomarinimicrobiota bacterium]MCF7829810.1 tRNA (adenosine(37)-N6)-threonylcarbamoyltransferase complex dimerization subunit type 1 TsaB [Candidatus Neomarinimicrobiota bacterium]MCF7881757.1 tRNA (adenosine(37)-N6)-threonylcarbamoyltransferase complex dimerization subunit type 1 TsaB [Candidatus Neomarinimicrobiota bacterium]
MRLLAIETATDVCSVAVADDGRVIGHSTVTLPRKHSELLSTQIRQLLTNLDIHMDDLEGIAVSVGPGSFTGMRIGVSTAKGLVFESDTALYAVPTLAASAWCARYVVDSVAVLHHSHRNYYFLAQYDFSNGMREITAPVRNKLNELMKLLDAQQPVLLQTDPGDALIDDLGDRVIFLNPVSAVHVASLAVTFSERFYVEDPYSLEPDYLRKYEAEKYKNPLRAE